MRGYLAPPMSDEGKKPRDIKDLRARLGRTGTSGAPAAQEGASLPPPAVGPFGASSPSASSAGATEASLPSAGAFDPFGAVAAPPQGPREVRLVIDEKPMSDAETGRSGSGRAIAILVGVVVGLALGGAAVSVIQDNKLFGRIKADAESVRTSVSTASNTVSKASSLVETVVAKAKGGAGRAPAVDYAAIEELRKLEKPLPEGEFARKFYLIGLAPEAMQLLHEYYNTIQLIWFRVQSLAATTLPPARRTELDQSATAAAGLASKQVGCVPYSAGDMVACGLVYVDMPAPVAVAAGQDPPALPEKLNVHQRSGSAAVERTRYTGQDLKSNPENYVVLVDTTRSLGVLGQQAAAFAEFSRDLGALKGAIDRAMQLQTQLTGKLAGIEEKSGE